MASPASLLATTPYTTPMNTHPPALKDNTLLASLGGAEDAFTLPNLPTDYGKLEKETAEPSTHYSPGVTSPIEERALSLLGAGVSAESVASALGVTPSRISQMLSEKTFSDKVAALRYESLQKHNARDGKYDSLEDQLITKMEKSLPLMVRPETILKAISTINGAKRRGQTSPDQVTDQRNVVNLILPSIIAEKIVINAQNQVIQAGEQELLTMPSGNLLKQVEEATTLTSQKLDEGTLLESL